jgi:hypothetical protein
MNKLLVTLSASALLLTGCGSNLSVSESSVSAPSSVDILKMKQEACSMFTKIADVSEPDNFREAGIKTTDLFDKLAKADPKYVPYAESVALVSITDFSDQTSSGLAIVAVRKIQGMCAGF